MGVEALLRPGEEEWLSSLGNLVQRFSNLEASTVADTLRQNDGHAGRTAQALRKLPAGSPSASTVDAPKKEPDAAPAKRVEAPLKKEVEEKQTPPSRTTAKKETRPYEAGPVAVAAKRDSPRNKPSTDKAAAPSQPVQPPAPKKESLPPPDSKMLFVAALQGDIEELNSLIDAGADLNVRYSGRPSGDKADKIIDATPLHLVVTIGSAEVAKVLLSRGADFEAKMQRALGSSKPPEELYGDMTALHLAAMEGHTSIVEMLLKHGADKKAKMQLTERKQDGARERLITPLEIAREMASKGHSRDSVISLLSK